MFCHVVLVMFRYQQDLPIFFRLSSLVLVMFECSFYQSIANFEFDRNTVCPKKYAHGFVVLCFVVIMQSFIMNSHEVFIHIHQGCFAGTGAIVRLPQCKWSKPDGCGKISQCITTTKHSKAKTVCIFLGIYCTNVAIMKHDGVMTWICFPHTGPLWGESTSDQGPVSI